MVRMMMVKVVATTTDDGRLMRMQWQLINRRMRRVQMWMMVKMRMSCDATDSGGIRTISSRRCGIHATVSVHLLMMLKVFVLLCLLVVLRV